MKPVLFRWIQSGGPRARFAALTDKDLLVLGVRAFRSAAWLPRRQPRLELKGPGGFTPLNLYFYPGAVQLPGSFADDLRLIWRRAAGRTFFYTIDKHGGK
jgi:hypothetical protein